MKQLFTLLALLSFSLFAQTVPNYVPTNGLVGWWPFNNNYVNSNSPSNTGTNLGGVTFTPDRNGNPNSSINVDGQNCPSARGVSINQSVNTVNDFTISIWTRTDNIQKHQTIFNTSPHTLFGLAYNHPFSPNNVGIFIGNGQGSWGHLAGSNNYPANFVNWNHHVFVKQGNQFSFYLNGVLKHSLTYTGMSTVMNNLIIGASSINGGINCYETFSGNLDDVGVWSRALNLTEIQTLYFGCTDTLSAQPVSVNASLGSTATFTAASSTSSATYQWQGKSGNSFVNLSNAGQFSGVTTGTLTVSGVTSANNGSEFRCIVDHGDCVDTSDVATLTACFDVTNQPFDRYVVAGTSTTFGLTTNDPSNCTYQWQTNAGFGYQNLSNAGQYSGTTSSTLAVANVSSANNNQSFRCIVTAGTCKDTTSEARIILSGVGVDESALHQLVLSPNPTSGVVRFNQPIEGSYRVITSEGRVVQKGEMGEAIDLSAYPDGIYQIEVQSSNERRTFKAVKQR